MTRSHRSAVITLQSQISAHCTEASTAIQCIQITCLRHIQCHSGFARSTCRTGGDNVPFLDAFGSRSIPHEKCIMALSLLPSWCRHVPHSVRAKTTLHGYGTSRIPFRTPQLFEHTSVHTTHLYGQKSIALGREHWYCAAIRLQTYRLHNAEKTKHMDPC